MNETKNNNNSGIINRSKKKKKIIINTSKNTSMNAPSNTPMNTVMNTIMNVAMNTGMITSSKKKKKIIMNQPSEEVEIAQQINVNIENSPVEPLFWILPNKKSFPQWVSETFLKYRANGRAPAPTTGPKKAFKYQKLLRDYMQNKSPYRGVLLFHELGAGKTMSSIIIAENLKTEKNIVVMLPASLKPNFEKEIQSLPTYQKNPEAWKEKYSFVSYNASNTLSQIRRLGSLDNKVIIIDEVHNLVSKMVSGIMGISKQGLEIYHLLMEAQNSKIVALSGTPVINDPFEIAVLMNILRGYIEITNFAIQNVDPKYGETWDFKEYEAKLAQIPFVDFIEINKVNKSISFHITVKSYTEDYRNTIEKIQQVSREHGVEVRFLLAEPYSLFPIEEEGEKFREYFIQEDPEKGDRIKTTMIPIFKSRILGLISYYRPLLTNYPEVIHRDIYRIDMSHYQYQIYSILREKERLTEKGSAKSKGKKKKEKTKSTFRVFSRQCSNFVFPEEIPRPYPDPKFIVTLKQKEKMNQEDFQKIAEQEEMVNNEGKISLEYKNRIENALQQLVENGETYLRAGPEGLDKLSPKMRMMLENIQQSRGLVFVYSNFRTLEGIEIFTKILQFNGFSPYGINDDKPKFAMYSGTEDQEQKTAILRMFTSVENKEGELCKILLATSAGAEGLDLKNIRQIHIMEPYWNQMRIQQVIGRGVRRGSHLDLPPDQRNIEIFRYFSVLGPEEMRVSREKVSTDEHIDMISQKKQIVLDELKIMMKECAFDCILNYPDIQGEYRCFGFGTDATGIAYFPQLSKNVVYTSRTSNVRTEKKELVQAIYFDKKIYLIDKKNRKMYLMRSNEKELVDVPEKDRKVVYVNPDNFEIYEPKSIKTNHPIRLGYVTKSSGFSKTKKD